MWDRFRKSIFLYYIDKKMIGELERIVWVGVRWERGRNVKY